MRKPVAVAALVTAVVLVPAASAKSHAVKLSVLPLPKSALRLAKSLPLDHDSGVVSNAAAATRAPVAVSTTALANLNRLSGYALDYGIGTSGGSGITEIATKVDQYVTAGGAKRGLRFWKDDDQKVTQLDQGSLHVTNEAVAVPKIGGSRFAFLASYHASNITPLFTVDEQFTQGIYEADVTVWAGTAARAKELAPQLAELLDTRIKQALAGELDAKPVKLPPKQKPGAVEGSPDFGVLALKPSDFGSTTTPSQGYVRDPLARSAYDVLMAPAGPFVVIVQKIEWYATANQAAFEADYTIASSSGSGTSPVDLSGIGDGAQGAITTPPTGNFGLVVLSSGKLAEMIVAGAESAVQPSDLENVAEKAAGYIDADGLGS